MSEKKSLASTLPISTTRLWIGSQLIFWGTTLTALAADIVGWTTFGFFDHHEVAGIGTLAVIFFFWSLSLIGLFGAAIDLFRQHSWLKGAIAAFSLVVGTFVITAFALGFLLLLVLGSLV